MRGMNKQQLQRMVDQFNQAFEVGDRVYYEDDFGTQHADTVRHPAQILSGHSAVCWLHGRSGCVLVDRISKNTEALSMMHKESQ